ncbi:MAG TPA: sigma-70 family RNA polymerase sigma factor [Ohtaekwangia sp.]|uniref:sigma-70 family RNA polymerase sigma factor n=1 Tax=Ohtaekwangia sp. TaxID=2066019 RepID=UPI002F928433
MEALSTTTWRFFENDLKGFVYKRVKDKALTEDIVHDVFIKVQNKIGQLQESKKITGWIYQITRNTIVDHFRKQSKVINTSDLNWSDDVANFNECVENALKKLLSTLPPKYREALQMAELENLSQVEMAARLGISYSGVKSRVQRARQVLKQKLNEALIIKTDAYGNVIVCTNREPHCC